MMRVFEISVLKKTFESKREEGTVEWRKLHNEKLCNLYCSRNINRGMITRKIRWECM